MPQASIQYDLLSPAFDDENGNGFISPITGSGSVLTSFKVSILIKENDSIHKCVFVRENLDRQTHEAWSSSDTISSEGEARTVSAGSANRLNRSQEGSIEQNTRTAERVRGLLPADYSGGHQLMENLHSASRPWLTK